MVGLRQLATRSPPMAVKSLENMSMKLFGCISLMSAPAANAFSLPVTRMQPILSSASRSSTAAAISPNTPNDKALSIFGRFSVMMPTAPLLSTMMYSNVLIGHPGSIRGGMCPLTGWASSGMSLTPGSAPHWGSPRGWGKPLRHEHARGGSHGQQRAEGDEDFSDRRSFVPGRAVTAGGCGGSGL